MKIKMKMKNMSTIICIKIAYIKKEINKMTLLKSVRKHFTIVNIITGVLSIIAIGTFKYLGISVIILNYLDLNPTDVREYILAGFFGLIFKLGIKGIIENYFSELPSNPEFLTMGGPSEPNPQGRNNQPIPQEGSSKPNPQEENKTKKVRAKKIPVPDWTGDEYEVCAITKYYLVEDPTGIRERGYINKETGRPYPTQQPYINNFAAALDHAANHKTKLFDGKNLFPLEIKYWNEYKEFQLKLRKAADKMPYHATELINSKEERLNMKYHS